MMTAVKAERRRLDALEINTTVWTRKLMPQFAKFYSQRRHGKKNKRSVSTSSVDVTFDIVSTVSDIKNYVGDALASSIGEHTMVHMLQAPWRRRMHLRNRGKTKLYQVLMSKPGPLGRRSTKRPRGKSKSFATKAMLQFAAYRRNVDRSKFGLSKPKLAQFLYKEHKVTSQMALQENPDGNPFGYKRQTVLDSLVMLKADADVDLSTHELKCRLADIVLKNEGHDTASAHKKRKLHQQQHNKRKRE